jgi:hypothetical protein
LAEVKGDLPGFDGEEIDNLKGLIARACIAIFDDYAADGPGYGGKLMIVVWPSKPDLYEVFIWKNEQLIHLNQDEQLRPKEKGREVAKTLGLD